MPFGVINRIDPGANAFDRMNPLRLIASSALAASGQPAGPSRSGTDAATLAAQRQPIMDYWSGATAAREAEANRFIADTQMGARAQRARQRAFSSMSGYRGGYDSTIHTTPLGLSSNPLGKGSLGM